MVRDTICLKRSLRDSYRQMDKYIEFNNGNEDHQMKKFLEFTQLNEFNFARLFQHLENRNVGILTAFRSRYTLKENRARNKQLETKIRAAGFGYTRAQGHYIEGFETASAIDAHEEVFIVIGDPGDDSGKLKGFLKTWGKQFNQDSVLYKEFGNESTILIGTQSHDEDGNSVNFPGLNKEVTVGSWHPNKMGQFYTKMKGRKFVFESNEYPISVMGALAKHKMNV